MLRMMVGDATARAITGDIVLARGIRGIDDGRGAGQGIAVIAIGETVTEMDGVRKIKTGTPAETGIMKDEVRLFFLKKKFLIVVRFSIIAKVLQDTQPKVIDCVTVPARLFEKVPGTDPELRLLEDPG